MSSALINSVRNFLVSHYMFADDDWVTGCVEYLTEDSANNYSERDIQNLAREQWMLNDLKDICPGSLPAGLMSQQKTVLDGRFVLQINASLDIGTPAYQQYMKLQKVNQENVEATTRFEDKIPSHRMIKLYLTDGVQGITAIEYKPMRNLSCDITPGCKVLIKGPVVSRRGVLLLTESNVELLGGEVSDIAVSNSLAGLLSSKLGLPLTQEPDPNTLSSHPHNTNIPTLHTQMPSSRSDPASDHRPIARVTSLQVASSFADDDIDIDQLAAIEAQLHDDRRYSGAETTVARNNNENVDQFSKGTNQQRKTNVDKEIGIKSINSRTEGIENQSSKRTIRHSNTMPDKRPRIDDLNSNTVDDYPTDNDLFFEDDDYIREMEANFDAIEGINKVEVPKTVSSEPYVYIKQINYLTDSDRAGRVFRVKAQIMKLLSKLSVGKDGWSLKCTIVDGTGSIDVDFTSGVLSKLVGLTPQEMNQLKKQMVNKPELKQKAVEALQKAKDTLQVLYCIIELTILDVAQITNFFPFEETHVDLLKRRTSNYPL